LVLAKYWSNTGQTLVKRWPKAFGEGVPLRFAPALHVLYIAGRALEGCQRWRIIHTGSN
jgi:hypothetical protein